MSLKTGDTPKDVQDYTKWYQWRSMIQFKFCTLSACMCGDEKGSNKTKL